MTKRVFITLLTVLVSLGACQQQQPATFSPPQSLDDGWETSAPEKEGFDLQQFEAIIAGIPEDNPKLDGLVIARNGKLVVDQYFNDYSADQLHKIWSLTKVFSSTIIGIAADKRQLSVHDSIFRYLGNYMGYASSSKKGITIEHLLTMTSGLEWIELGGPKSIGFQLPYSPDWVEYTLSQKHTAAPGKLFNYSTGNTMLLAAIIKKATGLHARDFAQKYLFEPLNITHYEWDNQSEFWTKTQSAELPGADEPEPIAYAKPFAELTNTGSGLRMRPRDLCKLGQLYLNNGQWKDRQIVSEKWIEASTQPHFGNNEYGYYWRFMTFHQTACYYTTGFGLQRIFVFPSLDLVIVLTQQHYRTMPRGNQLTEELLEAILAAVRK